MITPPLLVAPHTSSRAASILYRRIAVTAGLALNGGLCGFGADCEVDCREGYNTLATTLNLSYKHFALLPQAVHPPRQVPMLGGAFRWIGWQMIDPRAAVYVP